MSQEAEAGRSSDMVTGVLYCADREEEMWPRELVTAAEEGRRALRSAACMDVCATALAASASSATGAEGRAANLCTVSRSNSSIIYLSEELGISTANCI